MLAPAASPPSIESEIRQHGDDVVAGTQQPDNQFSFPQAAFDVVALAASAGGLTALSQVLSGLPADFPATIAVVQHCAALDITGRSPASDA